MRSVSPTAQCLESASFFEMTRLWPVMSAEPCCMSRAMDPASGPSTAVPVSCLPLIDTLRSCSAVVVATPGTVRTAATAGVGT
jgi:hypothetical protein